MPDRPPALPDRSTDASAASSYSLAFVCLGNICRSPMAQVVLASKVREAGLTDVRVTSSGTGEWHIGERMDARAAETLTAAGYDPSHHRAQQFDRSWFDDHDLLLAMDASNHADVLAQATTDAERAKVQMFRTYDPGGDFRPVDVPDPYYGGASGFDDVLAMVERTTDVVCDLLADRS